MLLFGLLFTQGLTLRQFVTTRLTPAALVLATVGGVAYAATRLSQETSPQPVAELSALPVEVASVRSVSSFQRTHAYTGRIQARRAVDLGFELRGRVLKVLVREGAHVERGAVLARLDTRRIETRRTQLQAQLEGARARLAEMVAGPRKQTIAATRAQVGELDQQIGLWQRRTKRRKALLARKVITQEALDTSTFTLGVWRARRLAAQRRLDELLAGTRQERLRAQRATVRRIEAELAQVGVDLRDSALRAPFTGSVGRVVTDEGSVVAPGRTVLRLVERGALEAWVGVPAREANRLRLGARQAIRVAGVVYTARVQALLPELDRATRTTTVILKVDDPRRGRLLPQQVVRLVLRERVPAAGVWLPLAALSKGERDLWSVLVVTSDEAVVARRLVEVVHVEAHRALVRLRLGPGEQVVNSGAHRVVPGQRVRPVPARGAGAAR